MQGHDDLIGLAEATRLLGNAGRGGKQIHPATLTRWILVGVKLRDGTRLKLRALRLGSKWATRPVWLDEFLDATTAAHVSPESGGSSARTPAERRRASEAAAAELEKLGA